MDPALERFSPATREWFAGAFPQPTAAQAGAWEAISSGGHARTGLEDNLRLDRHTLAPSNAALVARLGMPRSLSAMGVPRDVIPAIAEAAVQDHSSATNPRPATAVDYARILEESFG